MEVPDGIVLGVLDQIALEESEVTFSPADLLICYTDGVTEAMNADLEEFGLGRLQEAIAVCADGSATEVLKSIVSAVDLFTGQVLNAQPSKTTCQCDLFQ